MRHRVYHSSGLREKLANYAERLGVSMQEITETYNWMLANDVIFEEGDPTNPDLYIVSVNIVNEISHKCGREFYAILRKEIPSKLIPKYGLNLATFKDRILRIWEQIYNIFINKIPSHNIRLFWLRMGGAKIGRKSTIWRNTEILGIENLVIGEDTCIAWHCQIDARAGLIIGNHVAIASYVKIIAGTHDLNAPEFWSICAPIYIEDYVWIATGALIGHGAQLGYGSVVTANTIVSKKIQPYKIVGGSGAKPMGDRSKELNYKVGGKSLLTFLY
jgi:acetyltransferase-like isoleucine patch superfamily enzyme